MTRYFNKWMRRAAAGLSVAIALAGCGGAKISTLEPNQTETIKSLSKQRVDVRPVVQADARPAEQDFSDVIAAYEAMIKYGPDDHYRARAMKRLADLRLTQGNHAPDYHKAIKQYIALLEEYPGYAENDDALYRLALTFTKINRPEAAAKSLHRLADQFPDSALAPDAYFRLGEHYFSKQVFDNAAFAYKQVIAADHWGEEMYRLALYKYGWSLLRLNQPDEAVEPLLQLLDLTQLDSTGGAHSPGWGEDNPLGDDALYALAQLFYQLGDLDKIAEFCRRRGDKPYDYVIYQSVADYYLELNQIADAVAAYDLYDALHPGTAQAALMKDELIDIYERQGDIESALKTKKEFVRLYGPNTPFWIGYSDAQRSSVMPVAKRFLSELTRHYHKLAQNGAEEANYRDAERFYRTYLSIFPKEQESFAMQFLLAELLHQNKKFANAVEEFEKIAYGSQDNAYRSEAAYAMVLAVRDQLKSTEQESEKRIVKQKLNDSVVRYAEHYSGDRKLAPLLAALAKESLDNDGFADAERLAQMIIDIEQTTSADSQLSAWSIKAHAAFEQGRYADAEQHFQIALRYSVDDKNSVAMNDWWAAAIYKQAETLLAQNRLNEALDHFRRLARNIPEAAVRPQAEFDAATIMIKLSMWQQAVTKLQQFRKRYPDHELNEGIPLKLAQAYTQLGQKTRAADEYHRVAILETDPDLQLAATIQAAELYKEAHEYESSAEMYEQFIRQSDKVSEVSLKARYELAMLYQQIEQPHRSEYWHQQVINSEPLLSEASDASVITLAAHSALALAEMRYREFDQVKLVEPLVQNIQIKKMHMEIALKAYNRAADYRVADILTESTYRIGEMYHKFGTALLESDRPQHLSSIELEQYNLMLEEEAIPFEERAIEILEVNVGRAKDGIYDEGVKQSFNRLKKIDPMRYHKAEKGERMINALH